MSSLIRYTDVVRISFELDLNSEEKKRLASILKCDEKDLSVRLESYARAALQEYTTLFLGQRVFTQGADLRAYRLFLLIKEVFENEIPNEQQVSSMFQTTVSQSRSLLRSVISRYQYELQEIIGGTIKSALSAAEQRETDGNWEVTVNKSLAERLNEILAVYDNGTIPRVTLKANSISTYTMAPSAYLCLCDHFDIAP